MHSKDYKIDYIYYTSLAFIVIGISIRLYVFLYNRPLWDDELCLALNIINKSLTDLLTKPLDFNQGAPLGFLLLMKLLTNFLGSSEYSLRLLSLVFGLLALMAFYQLSKKLITPKAIQISLAFFALSYYLIYYSAEVKQYSTDVFITILLLYMGTVIYSKEDNIINYLLYAITGSLFIWLSYPAIFVLSAIAFSVAVKDIIDNSWKHLYIYLIIFSIWAISFSLLYYISLRHLVSNEYLINFWNKYYVSLPILSLNNMKMILSNIFFAFGDPRLTTYRCINSIRAIYIIPLIMGCITLYSKDRYQITIFLATLGFVVLASYFKKYPLGSRLCLFLAPIIILLVGQGLENIRAYIWYKNKGLGALFLIFILIIPIARASSYIIWPSYGYIEDTRSVFSYVQKHYREGDKIYLYNDARYSYSYYKNRYPFPDKDIIIGTVMLDIGFKKIPENVYNDMELIMKNKRVWVILTNMGDLSEKQEKMDLLNLMEKYGKVLEQYKAEGATVYLLKIENN